MQICIKYRFKKSLLFTSKTGLEKLERGLKAPQRSWLNLRVTSASPLPAQRTHFAENQMDR